MKTKAFFILLLYVVFFFIYEATANCGGTTTNSEVAITQLSRRTFEFTACIPPAPILARNNQPQVSKYLWQFADGRFTFDNVSGKNRSTVRHTFDDSFLVGYAGNGNELLKAATVTPVKDDKEDPFSIVVPVNVLPSTGNARISDTYHNEKNIQGRGIKLMSNHNPSPGDTVIYIIVLDDCDFSPIDKITFSIDHTIFDVNNINVSSKLSLSSNYANSLLTLTPTATNTFITEQTNIFIQLETLATATLGKSSEPKVKLEYVSDGECSDVSDFLEQKTVKSHDPNFKTVNITEINQTGTHTLEYYIEFQNIGNGPAHDVIVKDVLHPFLDMTTLSFDAAIDVKYPTNIQCYPNSTNPPSSLCYEINGREITWTFSNKLDLEGTRQDGLNQTFFEEDTKGWIKFRIDTDSNQNIVNGSILPNKADIIFDTHPVIATDDAITKFVYYECDVPRDTTIVLDTICVEPGVPIELTENRIPKEILDGLVRTDVGGLDDVLLYHTSGEVKHLPVTIEPKQSETQLIVVTKFLGGECIFYYFYQPIKIMCDAPILEVTEIEYNCGDSTKLNYALIQIMGGEPPYYVRNGTTIDTIYTDIITEYTQNDFLNIWVTDNNDCMSDLLNIDFGADFPLSIGWDTTNCKLKVKGLGGQAPYTYEWNDGTITDSIDYCNAVGYQVTVTDARGCMEVLDDSIFIVVPPPIIEGLKVFPNPASKQISFEWEGIGYQKGGLSICDMQGRLVLQEKWKGAKNRIDLNISHLRGGIYSYHIQLDDKQQTAKFIKLE